MGLGGWPLLLLQFLTRHNLISLFSRFTVDDADVSRARRGQFDNRARRAARRARAARACATGTQRSSQVLGLACELCALSVPLEHCRMSEDSVRGAQLARLQYATGDNAADRRADALALSNKLRCEYEHRSLEQDPMSCARCAKELVRCLTKQDVTDCYYHRGKLCAARNSRGVGVPRWSCCQLGEGAAGCQRGGRHKFEAVHPTFDSWFDNWATATGQGIAPMRVPSVQEVSLPLSSSVSLVVSND